jgi:hypothetical protein
MREREKKPCFRARAKFFWRQIAKWLEMYCHGIPYPIYLPSCKYSLYVYVDKRLVTHPRLGVHSPNAHFAFIHPLSICHMCKSCISSRALNIYAGKFTSCRLTAVNKTFNVKTVSENNFIF